MLTIYTGHHLNSVVTNIKLVTSSLDAPETTIQKATNVFEQSKDAPVIIRTNDILFLDAIKALAMENDRLDVSLSFISTMTTLITNSNSTKTEASKAHVITICLCYKSATASTKLCTKNVAKNNQQKRG